MAAPQGREARPRCGRRERPKAQGAHTRAAASADWHVTYSPSRAKWRSEEMPGFKDLSLFFDCRGHGSPKGERQDVKMQEVLSPQMDPFFKEWKKTAPGADGYPCHGRTLAPQHLLLGPSGLRKLFDSELLKSWPPPSPSQSRSLCTTVLGWLNLKFRSQPSYGDCS